MRKAIIPTALIAVLSLSSAAYGGAKITSAQIKDGTIQARDLSQSLRTALATHAAPGPAGPAGASGAQGPQGAAGPAGAPGNSATNAPEVGTLSDASMAVGAPTKTFGTVGPFTLKMTCTDGDPQRNMSNWNTSLKAYTEIPNVGQFTLAYGGTYEANVPGRPVYSFDRDFYASAWHTSGANLWVTGHARADQNGCSISNIKTYLTDY